MNNKIKYLFICAGVFFCILQVKAKVYADPYEAGNNYLAYPVPDRGIPQLSPTPEGYIPFHMEHYGRHGSRWLIGSKDYTQPLEIMQKAHDKGVLTPRGEELYEEIKQIAFDSKGRLGELTPLGHRQHRGIANRMAQNFPEIFNDSTLLDAKSTEVIRCILSMANGITELQKLFPDMRIKFDASQVTQSTLNFNPYDTIVSALVKEARPFVDRYRISLPKPDAFFDRIFTDREFVRDSLGEDDTFRTIFHLAVNIQSHDDYPEFFDIFTPDELNNEWLVRNADWYIQMGNTPLTANRAPFNQRHLLRNIIESADTALLSPNISANLRYGHDTMLGPLSVLMEFDNFGYETADLSTLADHWKAFEIFPMASNIQIVLYRPSGTMDYSTDDILVKALLNEKEVTLPVTPVFGKYYRWNELREYYLKKLDTMPKP